MDDAGFDHLKDLLDDLYVFGNHCKTSGLRRMQSSLRVAAQMQRSWVAQFDPLYESGERSIAEIRFHLFALAV
ncbi:hypothetical protein BR1R3_24160 [Pseudomonas atacamensis]|jgi:hypothetical protein|nr:hypothetical protein BR1R3_24160 [Pseudomonas atacamensis]